MRFPRQLALVAFFMSSIPVLADESMSHEGGLLPAPPRAELARAVASIPLTQSADRVIIVRYLGYRCAHCVEQLTYLNEHASELKRLGISVVAISTDASERWEDLVRVQNIDTSVFGYVADPDGAIARSISAQQIINDTLRDLHATIVRVGAEVRAAVYSDSPYMDVARIIGQASEGIVASPTATTEYVDRYLQDTPTIKVVASPADGIREPIDLDFNRSPLAGRDLWVVMGDQSGHAMSIIHQATTARPVVQLKKDSRAYHFMWRTTGIAMGTNGSFGTAQNGEPGDGEANYMFMGPTLWSSDTAVFASRYQEDQKRLASHLDMLHQSPWCLGIAHDSANIYWVLDAKYPGISRYDFRDPHEVGGTDHRDGIIRRYIETSITPGKRDQPAHVSLDRATGWLYYVDPGKGLVHRLNTRSGRVKDTLEMPPSSAENLSEFTSVVDARFETVISDSLKEPVGIDVVGQRLLVGDRADGRIHVYDISKPEVSRLGAISTGAKELLGLTVGPDQRIWFVDRTTARVCRIDIGTESSLTAARDVVAAHAGDTLTFEYANAGSSSVTPTLKVRWTSSRTGRSTSWEDLTESPTIAPGQSGRIEIVVPMLDTLDVTIADVAEFRQGDVMGLQAATAIVPSGLRRVIVQDERNGTFDIREAVALTSRMGYVTIPSDVFLTVADQLKSLKTVLWNSGSFGEISSVDEAVMMSMLARNVDMFLIADDPLALRLEFPMSGAFFRSLGAAPLGAESNDSLKGQRIFTGVLGDPVTAGMTLIDCQLPRLNHQRGGNYVPNFLLRPLTGSKSMMIRKGDTASGAVRFEKQTLRCIVMGVNASRFLDGQQRSTILDRGLAWLEEAANPDTVLTSVDDSFAEQHSPVLVVNGSRSSGYAWRIDNADSYGAEQAVVEVYSTAGQRMLTAFDGRLADARGTFDVSNFASGCYFVIVRTMDRRLHSTFIIQ
ncbi:MAG: redoxin domain-containing protein [Candidatus Kapabacteria bacterium]|nr:redoxin domain-containing protein [Candidatus Kapabacteria bacterium]